MPDGAPPNVLKIGFVFIITGVVLCLLPLLLPRWNFNKYIVTLGVIGLLVGLNFCLQGVWDRWKSR
jgi:uncharacterized membrane protein HdeD (DUF308 family)